MIKAIRAMIQSTLLTNDELKEARDKSSTKWLLSREANTSKNQAHDLAMAYLQGIAIAQDERTRQHFFDKITHLSQDASCGRMYYESISSASPWNTLDEATQTKYYQAASSFLSKIEAMLVSDT